MKIKIFNREICVRAWLVISVFAVANGPVGFVYFHEKYVLSTNIPSKQTKKDIQNQRLDKHETMLNTFPDTTFILVHGGCFEFENMVNLLKNHQNVYTDISIQPVEYIKTLIEEIGSERILFGTDYPFVT